MKKKSNPEILADQLENLSQSSITQSVHCEGYDPYPYFSFNRF